MEKEKIKNEMMCRLTGAVSGLLLAIPNIYPVLAPMQVFALIPVLYIGAKRENSFSKIFTAGIYMGLFYTLPQMVTLRMPIPITMILIAHLVIIMIVLAVGSAWLIRRNNIWGAFATGAFLVILDWINFTAIPLWGTAQSIVRPWSQYPYLIQFSSLTGITGIIFVLGTIQALIVGAIINPQMKRRWLSASIIIVIIFAIADFVILAQQPTGKIKVAAIGWATKDFKNVEYAQTEEGFEELFIKPAIKAAGAGAKLIVSPEMGFYINDYDRDEWQEKFQKIAGEYNVFLAVGYFDASRKLNQLMFITPCGKEPTEYSKTYLIPFYEKCGKGDGKLYIIDADGISFGGMICHDDNFTRLSREYGRHKTGIIAVPTMDWATVKSTHLQNSIHRAIESRYAIVRATMNGISAIVAPDGRVLAKLDHFKKGAGVIVAEVPVYNSSATIFSMAGHWPVAVGAIFLIIFVTLTIRSKK
ncbi:MAG: hypothetical protein A2Y10_13600 [Planctomycetes bacterium GWF2_41_51]|nr:MAG: hypothetical protein A2Y10_13600 [Planctomycetes bacterium GWF2_41_51]HBG27334.1 hypothetical protein [Phycisphaerales bacterium]